MINSKQKSCVLLLAGLLSLMLGGRLFSQAKEAFVNRYDGPAHGDDEASAMKIDSDGNIYVTGTSARIGTGMDYLTIKYSPEGERLWVRYYDGPAHGADSAHALALDADGNVYVTGESLGVGTDTDYATIKYDPDGNELWVQRYDGPDHLPDYAVAIAVDDAGHVYVTGSSKSRTNDYDFVTLAYDSNDGRLLWVRRYNGPANECDMAAAVAVDSMGDVYVTGSSEGEDTHLDYATIKYSPDGRELWLRRYNGPDNFDDIPWALVLDDDDNLYVTGQSTGLSHNYDITTVKYDADGRQVWVQRFNKNGERTEDNVGRAITVDEDGFIYVAGSSVQNGLSDYVTLKYDADGHEVWYRLYRGSGIGVNIATAVAVDPDGNVYVTGRSAGNRTGLDYATIEYDADGVMQWLERYDGPAHAEDAGDALALDDDGNVYVTGSSVGVGTGKDCVTIKYTKRKNPF